MKTRKILSVLLTTIILIICISGVAKGYYFDDGPADYYAYFGIDDIWYSYIDESKTSATVVEINNKSKEICVPEKVVKSLTKQLKGSGGTGDWLGWLCYSPYT